MIFEVIELLLARREKHKDGSERSQTLREHSLAVAEMTKATCGKIGLAAVGELASTPHDAGKSPPRWQEYLCEERQTKIVEHSLPGASFIEEVFQNRTEQNAGRLKQMLALAVRGHHGGLRDVLRPDGEDCTPDYAAARIDGDGKNAFFEEVVSKKEMNDLFSDALEEESTFHNKLRAAANCACCDKQSYINAYQVFRGLSERFLYSALIDADRYDAARWEDGRPLGDWRRPRPDWPGMRERLRQSVDAMPAKDTIPQLRRKIAGAFRAFDTGPSGVYRAFVPTGGGKTLSTADLGFNMADKYEKDHVYFVEPYLTILEQNAGDVREKSGGGDAVFEHHSNVLFEDDEGGEKLAAYQKRSERWDAPVIFTSLVQFLNALYSGKSAAARRMCALANSVIIIDEVQAVPLTSQYLFDLGVSFLAEACGCIVVLCTATPPALEKLPYPLRFSRDIISDTDALYEAFRRTEIDTSMTEGRPREPDEIAAFLAEKQAAEGSVLAIMNTKGLAKKLCGEVRKRVPDDVPVYYLSTYLCAAHRSKKLDEIRALLRDHKPVVCVTTQLIEAGVDISFNCVIRALAGLDSILQAAGRCNRHGENGCKTVYVVKCAGEERALAFLPEIARGQTAALRLINETKNGFYGGDLQSPAAIEAYYTHYYADEKNRREMAYISGLPGYGGKFNAVDLLGVNMDARKEFEKCSGNRIPPDQLAQSFQTAGRAYHVIPEDTVGVLVPWGDGAALIEQLKSAEDAKTRASLLRQAQRYSVNLFKYELNRLLDLHAVTADRKLGAYILDADHYSGELGVVFDEYGNVEDFTVCKKRNAEP